MNALAYARARKAAGESDFTRAARQQQILIALRNAVTKDGSLFFKLNELLRCGRWAHPDRPAGRLGCPSWRRWSTRSATTRSPGS